MYVVRWGPRIGFVAEKKGNFVTIVWTPWVQFSCFCVLLPTFFILSLLIPVGLSACSYAAIICLLRTLSKYVVRVLSFLCHLHPASSRKPFLILVQYFFAVRYYFSGDVLVVLSYPVRWAVSYGGLLFLGYKQTSLCFQASYCPAKRGSRAGASRNEFDYSRRGT